MPATKAKTKSAKSKDAGVEVTAKWDGKEFWKDWEKDGKSHKAKKGSNGAGGMLYFVGFVGALIYWMQAAIGFGAVVTGFLKALVWPAYVVYKLLENFYGVVN